MRRQRFLLITLIALLIAVWMDWPVNFPVPFPTPQVLAQTPGDRKAEADRLLDRGVQQYDTSQFEAAIQSWQQALTIYCEIKDRSGEGRALGNLGRAYSDRGDYAKAIEYAQQKLAIARDIKDRISEGYALNNLVLAYLYLGDYAKAIDYSQQWLVIARDIKDRQSEGIALGNLGIAYFFLRDYAKAIEYHQQSLAIARSIKDRQSEGSALGNLGITYRFLGDYAKAIEYSQQVLAIARDIKNRQSEGIALGNLGIAYLFLGDYAKAIDYSQQWLAIARDIKDRQNEGIALNNLGYAYLESGNLGEAEKKLFNAIEVWESIRKDLGSNDAFKVSIFDTQADAYRLLQKVLIAQNKPEAALEIAERGRARAFVELLASRLAAVDVRDVADKPSGSPTNNPSVTSRTTPLANPPSVAKIQQIAKEQKATLVEYSIIRNETIFIWVIQPTGAVAFRQVDLKSLDSSLGDVVEKSREDAATGTGLGQQDTAIADFVRGTREELGVQNRDITFNLEAAEAATKPLPPTANFPQNPRLVQLHKVLIEPIADLLPADPNAHIIFIPQGSLFSVPFPALLDASGKYLIEKHTILTAPSIQVLDFTHQHARTALSVGSPRPNPGGIRPLGGLEALVVGNPTMPSISTEIGKQPAQLAPLPGSEREAKNIAALLNTQPLIGAVATETAVVQQMSGARLIHLATHGLMDDFTGGGLPGAIALAPTSSDDGLLTASEILALKLNADLIVVSACDTGRGRLTGDGVIGLSRSLITAGASSLIVSLWSVPDSPTASLMTEFYRQMSKTSDKALALRLAMLTTMQQHPYPRDWAAFTLIGEAQ